MSEDEQDRLEGQTRRELREQRRYLACLEKKRELMAADITHAATRLYEPVCYSPESLMYELPSREERCQIVNDLKAAKERVEKLTGTLRGMTGEGSGP